MATGLIPADIVMYFIPGVTFAVGLLVGYLAQKSGFCSIGGFRDLLMFRQTRLFFGYLALVLSSLASYFLFALALPAAFPTFFAKVPQPGAPDGIAGVAGYALLAVIGGFGMGFLGVILGGCPLRQMVMGSEGNVRSWFFVLGLMTGAVVFHLWISGWLGAVL